MRQNGAKVTGCATFCMASGKVTIRRKKQPISEEDADYLKIEKTMKSLQQQIAKMRPARPTTPAPEVVEKHTKEPKANLL